MGNEVIKGKLERVLISAAPSSVSIPMKKHVLSRHWSPWVGPGSHHPGEPGLFWPSVCQAELSPDVTRQSTSLQALVTSFGHTSDIRDSHKKK